MSSPELQAVIEQMRSADVLGLASVPSMRVSLRLQYRRIYSRQTKSFSPGIFPPDTRSSMPNAIRT